MTIVSERPTPADPTWDEREQERRDELFRLRGRAHQLLDLIGERIESDLWSLAVSHAIALAAIIDEACGVRIDQNRDQPPHEPDRTDEP